MKQYRFYCIEHENQFLTINTIFIDRIWFSFKKTNSPNRSLWFVYFNRETNFFAAEETKTSSWNHNNTICVQRPIPLVVLFYKQNDFFNIIRVFLSDINITTTTSKCGGSKLCGNARKYNSMRYLEWNIKYTEWSLTANAKNTGTHPREVGAT